MPGLVYILCAATSFLCAVMLLRGFFRTGVRLLLWSGLCFVGLTLNNVILMADRLIFPQLDLLVWRHTTALAAVLLLVYGLVRGHD